jgi:hypothetical protein
LFDHIWGSTRNEKTEAHEEHTDPKPTNESTHRANPYRYFL